ncbi:unnamed protein product [Amoebophrya sp. A25]|nr:unnamed protein product [Amoebophrya sp. A25]|eukprot:GSA25T00004013001.1
MSVSPKWSYPSKQDFNQTFFKAGTAGKRAFADLLAKNFKLEPPAPPARNSYYGGGGGGPGGMGSGEDIKGLQLAPPPPSSMLPGGLASPLLQAKAAELSRKVIDLTDDGEDEFPRKEVEGACAAASPEDLTREEQENSGSTSTEADGASKTESEMALGGLPKIMGVEGGKKKLPPTVVVPAAPSESNSEASAISGKNVVPKINQTNSLGERSFGSGANLAALLPPPGGGSFGGGGPIPPSGGPSSSSSSRSNRIYVGLTGKNRDYLLAHPEEKDDFDRWLQSVLKCMREEYRIDTIGRVNFLDFLSTKTGAKTEAAYELSATQWLLQNGDLDMDLSNIPVGAKDTRFAALELKSCIEAIFQDCPERNRLGFWREKYLYEFRDFGLEREDLDALWLLSVEKTGFQTPTTPKDRERLILALLQTLLDEPRFLRAMTRARLFQGTISAGGGSCQVTCQPQAGRAEVSYGSIPFGNRTSYSGGEGGLNALVQPVWDKSTSHVTRDMLAAWSTAVSKSIEENKLPTDLRGLFVGISAVFHAAKFCKCDNAILPKNEFLSRLEQKLELELLKSCNATAARSPTTPMPAPKEPMPEKELRNVSNLQLVHTFVSRVLHESAFIVCKRNWNVEQPEGGLTEYVATWSFGFWLTSVREPKFRKQGSNLSDCSSWESSEENR